MIFNSHFALAGAHAALSPSKYHWMNYDMEKMDATFRSMEAAKRGSDLHDLAAQAIRLGVKLQGRTTMARYVNDCIGWKMVPEQMLVATEHAFGTADAISFRKNVLRISDLKTGVTPASIHQLEVYAAFFCIEYGFKPAQITIEMRIYQNDEVLEYAADPDVITHIMDRTLTFSALRDQIRAEEAA